MTSTYLESRATEEIVLRVCSAIRPWPVTRIPTQRGEEALLFELAACILGSRVRYEVARTSAERLLADGLFSATWRGSCETYEREVAVRLLSNNQAEPRYPFAQSRAPQLAKTVHAFRRSGFALTDLLNGATSPRQTRQILIGRALGIGPKQASLFLRNVGVGEDLAVLDSHILKYMEGVGLLVGASVPANSLSRYEEIERRFIGYSIGLSIPSTILDVVIWSVMRQIRSRHLV